MSERNSTIAWSVGVFYLIALPLIITDYNVGRAFFDQSAFHLPTIKEFIERFYFVDYPSATTPGYHAFMAVCGRYVSENEVFLKSVSSLITAVFVGLYGLLLYRAAGRVWALVLIMPMIMSLYILPDGVWLVPDNLAWLLVGLTLFMAADNHESATAGFYFRIGAVVAAAVLVRQSYLWLAGVSWAVALSSFIYGGRGWRRGIQTALPALLLTVPAFLLLLYFYQLWGGLVPPRMQGRHQHLSYSAPAFFLSLYFVYSFFYLPCVLPALRKLMSGRNIVFVGLGCGVGLLLALLPATDYNYDAGRFSGFWNFVRIAPVIGHTSLLLLVTSCIGGGLLVCWFLLLDPGFRLVMAAATCGFVLSLLCNAVLYERYFSGFLFILIFTIIYKTKLVNWHELPRWSLAGPLLFALINSVFLVQGHLP